MTEAPLTAEQRDLAAEYVPYARAIARSFQRSYGGRLGHDIDSDCLLALVQTAQRFDPSRKLAFKTMLGHRIRGECLSVFRRGELDRERYTPLGPEFSRNIVDDRPGVEESAINRMEIDRLLSVLEPESRTILRMWSEGCSFAKISTSLNITKSWVKVKWERALDLIREKARIEAAHEWN